MATTPARERVFIAQPSNVQAARGFAAAFQFLTTGEDNFRLRSWCSVAGVTVSIQGRQVRENGEIFAFGETHTPNSDRTQAESFYSLDAGAVLNVGVFVASGAVKRGECFIELALVRGLGGATFTLGTLVQGYVSTAGALAWPGSPLENPTDGSGVIRAATFAVLGGAELGVTVPTNVLWRLLSVAGRLTCSAAAGTRAPILTINNGTTIYMRSPQKQTSAPLSANTYTWLPGMPLETVLFAGAGVAGLPVPCFVPAGHQIVTITPSLDFGDAYSDGVFMVEEWIRP